MEFQGTSVGLDVHARSIAGFAVDARTEEVWRRGLSADPGVVIGWIGSLPGPVRVAYEAGPTGFVLARALSDAGIDCQVVAPSKLLRAAGDRVKTDKRDAALLARQLRLGAVTVVRVPTIAEEHARDLVRARDDARRDLMAARHRLSKMLLRNGFVYEADKTTWTRPHERWLRECARGLDRPQRVAFDSYFEQVAFAAARRDRLERVITTELATDPAFASTATRLGCLRGISEYGAIALTVEIADFTRFTASSIGAFLGLVPSESSSGTARRQGAITRAGNTFARRLLVEAAWHHLRDYGRPSVALRARWAKAPAAVAVRAHEGNQRLNRRWRAFEARKKNRNVADVAIARELAAWCWELATMNT